ncbi:VOC family protein [Chitinophagaceae bacterium MMS25-I14]
MATLNPYLNFQGNTEEAFNFYKAAFGGEFQVLQRFGDTPQSDQIPENEKNLIMHVALPIKGNTLMGTDNLESMGHTLNMGDNISLSLSPESEEETHQLFDKLSAGGNIIVPLQQMFWGALFGMFVDKFGIKWMINYETKQQ